MRVFPDARMDAQGNVGQARDHVLAKVELTVAPPRPLSVYIRSFDVDDPSAEANAVDNDTTAGDNRGIGSLLNAVNDTMTLNFPASANQRTQSVDFVASKQPGDNFRLVANGDQDFVLDLENNDTLQGLADTTLARNQDLQRVINPYVTGILADREVRNSANYASNTLTVWRFLTIELDTYPGIQQFGIDTNANQRSGTFVDFIGSGTALTQLIAQHSLDDGSPDLNGPVIGNGRFENGTLYLGDPGPNPRMSIGPITANGNNNITFPLASIAGIGFTAQDTTAPTPQSIAGTITQVTRSSSTSFVWTLNLTSQPPANWNTLVGGQLTVGSPDEWMTITAVNAAQSQVTTSSFRLHYSAGDDDDLTLLPFPINGLDPIFARAFQQAYVESVLSPFGNGTLTGASLPLNVVPDDISTIEESQLNVHRDDDFWAAYNIWAWQLESENDSDPNEESQLNFNLGLGSGRGVTLGGVSVVAIETARDTFMTGPYSASWAGWGYTSLNDLIWRTTAHEVGHQFGLPEAPASNLMSGAEDFVTTTMFFRPSDLADIRTRITSPGA